MRWVGRKEVRFLNEIVLPRRQELTVELLGLDPNPVLPPAIYLLVDLTPVGGWKGNTWAILKWDIPEIDASWYATRSDADVDWNKVRNESARQEKEG